MRACLRECQKALILALYSISGAFGQNFPVLSARHFGLMTDGQHCPSNTQRGTFSRPWVREAGKNGVREGGLSWCSFTGFSSFQTAGASCQWRSHGGSAAVRLASRDSLVGSRYPARWCGDSYQVSPAIKDIFICAHQFSSGEGAMRTHFFERRATTKLFLLISGII